MHLKVVACEVLGRELYHCAASALNTTDVELLTQGLHDNPDVMRARLQERIDAVQAGRFDAVLLGYGLCSNGAAGLRAANLPLVIPRAHDCITLLLGSKERYAALFREHPGTYYYSSGWIEYEGREGERVGYTAASGLARRMALREFIEKYGEENGRFLFESMTEWEVRYTRGALITFDFTGRLGLAEKVRSLCAEKGWRYAELPGDLGLVRRWLDGEWDEEHFLIVKPGQAIEERYDESVMGCRDCSAGPC